MVVLKAEEIRDFDVDTWAIRVFLKALELVGGPRKLMEYRNLTWIPSLMVASYAVVLKEFALKTEDEIAEFTGVSKQTIRNILRADENLGIKKIMGEIESKDVKVHTAGSLAKLALKEIKEGRDHIIIFSKAFEIAYESLGITWPIEVLRRIKGLHFPVGKEQLLDRLSGLVIESKIAEDILDNISYPVSSPAELLHKIKLALG